APPALSRSIVERISALYRHDFEGRTRPEALAYTTMETRSFSLSCSTSCESPHWIIGSSSSIEPETSMRKTRLLGGRRDWSMGFAAIPTRANRFLAFHGQAATSTCTAKGSALEAGGGASS